jgi:hypothetical protein
MYLKKNQLDCVIFLLFTKCLNKLNLDKLTKFVKVEDTYPSVFLSFKFHFRFQLSSIQAISAVLQPN